MGHHLVEIQPLPPTEAKASASVSQLTFHDLDLDVTWAWERVFFALIESGFMMGLL
jgi:hypothetical protein